MSIQTKPINSRFEKSLRDSVKYFKEFYKGANKVNSQEQRAAKVRTAERKEELHHAKKLAEYEKKRLKSQEQQVHFRQREQRREEQEERRSSASANKSRGGMISSISKRSIPTYLLAKALGYVVGGTSGTLNSAQAEYSGTLTNQRAFSKFFDAGSSLDSVLKNAKKQGYKPEEVISKILPAMKAVGVSKPHEFSGTETMDAIIRGELEHGVGSEQSTQFLASLRNAGVRNVGAKELNKAMRDGVESGLGALRVDQHLANIDKGVGLVGQRLPDAVNVSDISSIMRDFGRIGSGFQGTRGESVMSAFQNLFQQGASLNAPEHVQATLLRHVGGFGGPGSQNNIFESIRQLDKGFNKENVNNTLSGFLSQAGGVVPEAALSLSSSTGGQISFTKAEKLLNSFRERGPFGEGEVSSISKDLEQGFKPFNQDLKDKLSIIAENSYLEWQMGKETFKQELELKNTWIKMTQELLTIFKGINDILIVINQKITDLIVAVKNFRLPGALTQDSGVKQSVKQHMDKFASYKDAGNIKGMQAESKSLEATLKYATVKGDKEEVSVVKSAMQALDQELGYYLKLEKEKEERKVKQVQYKQESSKLIEEAKNEASKTADTVFNKMADNLETQTKVLKNTEKHAATTATSTKVLPQLVIVANAPSDAAEGVIIDPAGR